MAAELLLLYFVLFVVVVAYRLNTLCPKAVAILQSEVGVILCGESYYSQESCQAPRGIPRGPIGARSDKSNCQGPYRGLTNLLSSTETAGCSCTKCAFGAHDFARLGRIWISVGIHVKPEVHTTLHMMHTMSDQPSAQTSVRNCAHNLHKDPKMATIQK